MPLPISNSRHVAVAEGGRTRVVAVADLAAALAPLRKTYDDWINEAVAARDKLTPPPV